MSIEIIPVQISTSEASWDLTHGKFTSIATNPTQISHSEMTVDIEQLIDEIEQFLKRNAHSKLDVMSTCDSPVSDYGPPPLAIPPSDESSLWGRRSATQSVYFSEAPHLGWMLLGEFLAQSAKRFSVKLAEALRDLHEVVEEAEEEGFPPPKEIALDNAKRLLREMYAITPRRYEVYPMPDGEVAIDAPDGRGSSVLLLCDSDGGALCLVNMKGKHRRARYSTTETLPDGFIREAMAELERQNN